MDPNSAVTTSVAVALIGFAACIALLLLLIARWKWQVFLALLLPILLFGLLPGVQRNNFIEAFETGFGSTLGSIGVVIVLGSIIAEGLRHTGAIEVITRSMVNLVGTRRMPLALTLTGFVLGVAIFSDVAYVILNPLVHSAAHAMGVGVATVSIGLVGALQLTHAIVPPTPGPLAAAALLGADVGKTIIFGGIACLVGSVAGWVWGQFVAGPRISTAPSEEFLDLQPQAAAAAGATRPATISHEPGTIPQPQAAAAAGASLSVPRAYAPVAVPVLLISAQSVARLTLAEGNPARAILEFVGWPVVALTLGLYLSVINVKWGERTACGNQWVKDGLKGSAMILVVTGLGGSLSQILKGTPAVEFIAAVFVDNGLPSILLPFVLGVLGNVITGSTTVGVITAASLAAPMLGMLGLSPEAAMLAGASGSVIIKYVNSSYFWVCTSLSGLRVNEALFGYGGVTAVGGMASFATVWCMWALGLV